MRSRLTLFLSLLFYGNSFLLYGQNVYINTPAAIYQMTGSVGSCTHTPLINECPEAGLILSLALYKDTIYYNTTTGLLKRFKVGFPASCETLAVVGGLNSMTVDKNGILYLTDNKLLRYNPRTSQLDNLGPLPFGSAGDLFYFNDKLLLAGSPAGIYEINITNTLASTLYMNTNGIRFFGLISFPESCNNIRYFGLSPEGGQTSLVELDLVNKVVVGTICTIPLNVFDAASVTESGINEGIIVTAMNKTHPCPPQLTGTISISAVSTVPGVLNYTLDNAITNTTGVFSGISAGNHSVRIISEGGCIKDTSFRIMPGLNSPLVVQKQNPFNCDNSNGSVTINATSNHTPINYTLLNTGVSQNSGNFPGLSAGSYTFRVADAAGCTIDTSLLLDYNPPVFVDAIETTHSHCDLDNGLIKLNLNTNAVNPLSSINNGNFSPALQYTDLPEGNYYIQVQSGAHCFFDTTIILQNIIDQKPQVQIQVNDQQCFIDNGVIRLQVAGSDNPYTFQLNGGGFGSQTQFANLAPGNYFLNIRNVFGCQWDTFAAVAAYPRYPVSADVQVIHPTCKGINDGSLTIGITGVQQPYQLYVNGRNYDDRQPITGLTEGNYIIEIKNNEQCTVDTLHRQLTIPYEQHCNDVYIPNAFTPDDDGLNDRLRPSYSSFIRNMSMSIFNRYGQKIFEGRGADIYWDGTYKGIKQPPAVYVYMISYTDYYGVSKILKGTLVLVR